jgi:hypothetical protein
MTDVAANSRTRSPYTLTVDGTAPTAVSVAGVNKTGGTAGKPETGDSLVLTYSEAVDPYSVLASWTGTSTPVTVRLTKSGSTGLLTVLVSGTALPLGSVLTDVFTNTTVDFTASTMTLSAGVVTVVLGTPTGAVNTSATTYNCSWTPAAGAFDAAGNPASTAARSETDNDKDF